MELVGLGRDSSTGQWGRSKKPINNFGLFVKILLYFVKNFLETY